MIFSNKWMLNNIQQRHLKNNPLSQHFFGYNLTTSIAEPDSTGKTLATLEFTSPSPIADLNQWITREICQRRKRLLLVSFIRNRNDSKIHVLTECSDREEEAINDCPFLENIGVGTNPNAKVENKVNEALLERQRCRLESICKAWLPPIIWYWVG